MNVDQAFKGSFGKTIELFDNGMCDGPELHVGMQYLMYTTESPGEGIPARGCTRSRSVEYADEDFKFLNEYVKQKPNTYIEGTVRFLPDPSEDRQPGESHRTPLKDVEVILSGNGMHVRKVTDSIGKYRFPGIAPGDYTIDGNLAGHRVAAYHPEVKLVANGCAIAEDLLMKVDRRVVGMVRNRLGAPIGGARVQMILTGNQSDDTWWPFEEAISDENGRYRIEGIPAGEYLVGVNIGSTPTSEHPQAKTYYPNTPDPKLAMRISVIAGPSVQELDLQLPDNLPVVTIHGRVRTADGKSPSSEEHVYVVLEGPGPNGTTIESESVQDGAEGRFEFDVCEGIRYRVSASAGSLSTLVFSGPVEFTATRDGGPIILTLDKTAQQLEEFEAKVLLAQTGKNEK